ncbi:protein farnesyltransferase [Zopfochytrium polystomum]|nr:protein farnesyltransferase [Zopfochytrium polystomum]
MDDLFADVVGTPQDDGPDPIVVIAYPTDYTHYMDIFRTLIKTNEKSERMLQLTAKIIANNPAHYTVWKVRQDTLFALNSDLRKELEYVTEVAVENPKNYQIWHHRHVVVERLGDGTNEIAFINRMLQGDSKNYHAWSYRQWVVKTFAYWSSELADIDRFLEEDIRNNSAWNQRVFYFQFGPEKLTLALLQQEVDFALIAVEKASLNESPWLYIKGLMKISDYKYSQIPQFQERITKWTKPDSHFVRFAACCLIEVMDETSTGSEHDVDNLYALLIERDPIRKLYWEFRRKGKQV